MILNWIAEFWHNVQMCNIVVAWWYIWCSQRYAHVHLNEVIFVFYFFFAHFMVVVLQPNILQWVMWVYCVWELDT